MIESMSDCADTWRPMSMDRDMEEVDIKNNPSDNSIDDDMDDEMA